MQSGFMCAAAAVYLISHTAHLFSNALSLPLCYFTTAYLFLQFAFSASTVSPPPAAIRKEAATENPLCLCHVVVADWETATCFCHGAAMAKYVMSCICELMLWARLYVFFAILLSNRASASLYLKFDMK